MTTGLASSPSKASWINFSAGFPKQINPAFGLCSNANRMAALVNFSQPKFWWEPGAPSRTVRTALTNKTPSFAQASNDPPPGSSNPRSLWYSLKILRSEGGIFCPFGTLKERPWACPGPWYGSWPTMMHLVCWAGHSSSAVNIWSVGGYKVWCWAS